jgi:2-hydroxy-3-keto-5-methylthiopentenyl-1-phosphate phosphatase
VNPLLIACDFDGTITQRDTLHVIVEEFGDLALWDEIEPRLRSGAMNVEQALQAEFDSVRVDVADVHRVVAEHAPVRPGFRDFVEWATAAGHQVLVCSNGFRSVIEPVLAGQGLDLELVANDARFDRSGTTIIWDDRGTRCELCDRPCKRGPMREYANGRRIAMIGDGISDRCGSGIADIVFARAGLAEDLAAQGREFFPFNDFHDVRAGFARLEDDA